MPDSDIAFHMAFQNVLLLQLISIGVCSLSATFSDVHREVCAWIVPTIIALLSIYICIAIIIQPQPQISDENERRLNPKWNGFVYILLIGLVLNVAYSGYNIFKQRTLQNLWKNR
jgi:hypothetical protein